MIFVNTITKTNESKILLKHMTFMWGCKFSDS